MVKVDGLELVPQTEDLVSWGPLVSGRVIDIPSKAVPGSAPAVVVMVLLQVPCLLQELQ